MLIRTGTSMKQKGAEQKIQLEIKARNFGPISRGKIILKPLTLFIGPNNSGKSYAAMLIHSLFQSYPSSYFAPIPRKPIPPLFTHDPHIYTIFDKEFPELTTRINNLKKEEELDIPKQFMEKATNRIFKETYEKRLTTEIIGSYASPLNELIKAGEKSFGLNVKFNSYDAHLVCRKDKLRIKDYPQLAPQSVIKVKVKLSEQPIPWIRITPKERELLLEVRREFVKRQRTRKNKFRLFLNELINVILDFGSSYIFQKISRPCYYLPAARSGILQGHKALAASMVKKIAYIGIESIEIPKFSGVVSDFISTIIDLPAERGTFYQLAQEFEKELINGEIILQVLDKLRYREIQYAFQNTQIPLHRASSTVSELAPLFLYLKYIIEPGTILIIEEPEAHLHPENQRILAKLLVRLIRRGVNLIITTHSEYLLDQLSSFILLSKIASKKRIERYKYNKEDFLKPDEIAGYLFKYDVKSNGHKIVDVKITEEDGISQEEFLRIHDLLYEETVKLRRDLSGKT